VASTQTPSGGDLLGGGSNPQLLRGAVLLLAAVLLGVFLLYNGFEDSPSVDAASQDDGSITSLPDDGSEPTVATTAPQSDTTERTAKDPAEVTVLVANGTAVSGVATQFSSKLAAEGYVTAEPSTGDKDDYATTTVYYNPDSQPEANAIAAALGVAAENVQPMPNPVPTRDADLRGATVLVLVGSDLAA
jgi:LytR cell envelope-related transcriptional attenuator